MSSGISADDTVAKPSSPAAGEQYKDSETTRLLCASAYLDDGFREEVLKHCLEERHRAMGPCFGLDMPTVVRHCRHAKQILQRRAVWLLCADAVLLVAVIVSVAGSPGAASVLVLLVLISAFAVCLNFESRARKIVLRSFLRKNFRPGNELGADNTSVEYLKETEAANALVYSGFTPFVGSGDYLGAWSFALDLRKRANSPEGAARVDSQLSNEEIEAISIKALYQQIEREISCLNLDRVTVQDKIYVNGRDIRNDTRFLRNELDRPRPVVSDDVLQAAMLGQAEKQLRHYRCIRVVDWDGELILSIFLRFSKLSHNLFVEASYYLLTPVSERFRKVDSIGEKTGFGKTFQLVLVTLLKTPFLLLFAPFTFLSRLQEAMKRGSTQREIEKSIRENPSFDYGAAFSFRQWASPGEYRRYFQLLDKEMYLKILEKNIFDSILTFLEKYDVDVSELIQRQTTILNNGVMVSGTMTAQSVAAGTGAKIENVAQGVTGKIAQFTGKTASAVNKAA